MTKRKTKTSDASPEDGALAPAVAADEAASIEEAQADAMNAACADDAGGVEARAGEGGANAASDADMADDENDFGQADDAGLAQAALDDAAEDAPVAGEETFALHDRPGPDETQALIDHLRAAPADGPLVLDAAAVEATGTPYVLALAAAARSRADAGAPAVLANPSAAVVDAFSDLGLFQDLMKMEFRP